MRSSPRSQREILAVLALTGCIAASSATAVGAVDRPSSPTTHNLECEAFYFRAKDGSVLALLMLGLLSPGDDPPPVPAGGARPGYEGEAVVVESDRHGDDLPGAQERKIPLDVAPAAAGGGRATLYGRVYLQSGKRYAVRYIVTDSGRHEMYLKNTLLDVPHLEGGFSASSVVPAEEFGPAGSGHGTFQVGSEEVVPKPGGVFRRSDLLRLYLQVYDAAPDHETGNRRVDVEFRFYRLVKGSSKRHGKPLSMRGVTGASLGLGLPIGDWPAGDYRVVVELHDRVRDTRTTTEGTFSIVAE